MLKISNIDSEISIETEGTMIEIIADIAACLHYLHVQICSDNLFMGREFEKIMRDPEFLDHIFNPCEGDAEVVENNRGDKK